jgi:hypothetical protein
MLICEFVDLLICTIAPEKVLPKQNLFSFPLIFIWAPPFGQRTYPTPGRAVRCSPPLRCGAAAAIPGARFTLAQSYLVAEALRF